MADDEAPQEKKAGPRPGRRPRPGDDNAPPARKVVEGGWGFSGDGAAPSEGKGVAPSGGSSSKGEAAGAKPQKAGRRRGVDSFKPAGEDDAAEAKSVNKFDDGDGDDILVIPDLEEDLEDDLTTQVAAAPRNINIKVQSMRELDHEIKHTLPTTMQNGLDLSMLTSSLSPQKSVLEDDETWEFDQLLQTVSQDMQVEVDALEEEKKKAKEAASAPATSAVAK